MTEPIENAEQTEQPTEPITEQAQDKKPKVVFSNEQQLHVNSLLKREREKEEAKWKDLLTAKDSQIAEYETGLQAVIDVQTDDFNPLVKKLLKNQPVMEQWKNLQDPEFVAEARKQNKTPKPPTTETKEHPVEKEIGFGGRY